MKNQPFLDEQNITPSTEMGPTFLNVKPLKNSCGSG
jgi:hypothetical protein